MKKLSPQVSEELWIKPSYAIVRFMKSKKAYKIDQAQSCIFTFKEVHEKNRPVEMQIHLRIEGKDHWNNMEKETIDVDIYIEKEEWEKVKK